MADKAIRAWDGYILGWIKTLPSGIQVATTQDGRVVGRYDPKFGFTTDANGVRLYEGNMLTATIPPDNRKG